MEWMEALEGRELNEHGIITSPGKFEGEHISIFYWYNAMMNGDGEPIGEDEGDNTVQFEVSAEDLENLGVYASEYSLGEKVNIFEDSSGFVYMDILKA